MLIQHTKAGDKGMFFVGGEGTVMAELAYTTPSADKIIIEHTEVDESMRNKGVGLQLVETLVDYARNQNIKVVPLCTFAKSVFNRKPELRDVLA